MTFDPRKKEIKVRRLIELRSLTSMRHGNVLPLTGIEPFFPLQTIERYPEDINYWITRRSCTDLQHGELSLI